MPTLVLVEGESDAAAVRALAARIGCDLTAQQVAVRVAYGVTNFPRVLEQAVAEAPGLRVCGMYDVAEERHVRRALERIAAPVAPGASLERAGFFACVADLEDKLIRALGTEAVERVLAAQGELVSFRRFQRMPQHRGAATSSQLRRFLGTRATRKIRCARLLVEALDAAALPRPLAGLAGVLWDEGG